MTEGRLPHFEDSALWSGSKTLSTRPFRDFVTGNSEIEFALRKATQSLTPAVEALRNEIPLPKTVMPFVGKPFFRPPGSHRSFYYCPATLSPENAIGAWPVLAIKGLEPCAEDYDALIRDCQRACYSPHNIAEHFVFEEQKIPTCLGLAEAIREAERAAVVQRAHLLAYGSLAQLPLPLFVFRHSEAVVAKVLDTLREILSAVAFRTVEPQINSGLGIYVYYYPTAPVRVRDVDFMLEGLDFRSRMLTLVAKMCDPEKVIRRWVRAFVRMLWLGFLPASLSSFRSGNCCQPQNACIDGGFLDLDSITPLEELRDDTAIYAALQFSLESLVRTVRTLIAGSTHPTRKEDRDVRVDLHYLTQYVLALIEEAVAAEALPGHELDTRISRYLTPARTVADLAERLNAYYSANSHFNMVATDFQEFTLSILAAASHL